MRNRLRLPDLDQFQQRRKIYLIGNLNPKKAPIFLGALALHACTIEYKIPRDLAA